MIENSVLTRITERLELRPPRVEDAPAIFAAYAGDPDVTRFLTWLPDTTPIETAAFLVTREEGVRDGSIYFWVIRKLGSETPAGAIEMRVEEGEGEIGYVLARSAWGNGFMVEAVLAVAAFAREVLRIARLVAICDVDNHASARVLEKSGFRFVGVEKERSLHPAISDVPRDARSYELDLK